MIAVVDYGLGNVRSVCGALEKIGVSYQLTDQHRLMEKAERLILPGVGAFGDAMKRLREKRLDVLLTKLVMEDKKPILGICLGAELMGKEGFEFGHTTGLGWMGYSVRPIDCRIGLRIPHVGWNRLYQKKAGSLFAGVPDGARFYFVHSYYMDCQDHEMISGESEYGCRFPAVVEHGNLHAVQFHPEKSQRFGLQLLRNFAEV